MRESLDDMVVANNAIRSAVAARGVAHLRSLYSPELMQTQIKAIDDKLMAGKYSGE